jgi:predicted nucleotidyltransferase
MRDQILEEIKNLEQQHHIKIVYAVESGSRAWGFASSNSDWDVRFFYVHDYDWYLSVEEKKDNIEIILPNDLDLSGWELKKALLLYRKSNPPLLEWLRSPIVYQEHQSTAAALRNASGKYFNPKSCLYHYLHMARGNWEAYFKEDIVRIKKYFYVLRPLLACCWIERTGEMAPMEFDIILDAAIDNPKLRSAIDALLVKKKSGEELDKGDRIEVIDEFIESKLAYYLNYVKQFDFKNTPSFDDLNMIFRQTLSEAWGKKIC